jgi:glycosyltransferase involved in cell wall biosynthesis
VRIVTWIYGGKMVISGQSGIGWDDRNNLWSFPDAFVALSSKAANWAKRANPFIKIKHIPNGVDIEKFTPKGPKLKTKLKKPIILCVGALTQTKRINLAIKAASRLKDASLLVVGDGELRQEIQKLGEKLLADRFQLIHLSFKEMPKVYRAANIFTLVSEPFYSFEIVLVEAMASGLPVVVNDDPIRREIIGRAGVLVDPTNINSYAKALQTALKKEWDDKPKEQAERFNWDKIAELYERLFEGIV